MVYNINILDYANADLITISNNLLEYGENPPKLFFESFQKFIVNVSAMPSMYPIFSRKQGYRKAPLVYNYIAYYHVNKKEKIIDIDRIISSKQNIDNLL